jgi:hypothetical protein
VPKQKHLRNDLTHASYVHPHLIAKDDEKLKLAFGRYPQIAFETAMARATPAEERAQEQQGCPHVSGSK